jgi:hypothetical protein
MAKKGGFFKSIFSFIAGIGGETIMTTLQEKVSETMDEAEARIERAVKRILTALTLFIILFTGFIFVLVGLAKYLTESVTSLNFGLGFVLVGACLIILALLIKVIAKT